MSHIKERDLVIEYAPNESPKFFVYVLVDQEDETRQKNGIIDVTGCLIHVMMAYKRGLDRPTRISNSQRTRHSTRWRPELYIGPFPSLEPALYFKKIVMKKVGPRATSDVLLEAAIELAVTVELPYHAYTKCLKQ